LLWRRQDGSATAELAAALPALALLLFAALTAVSAVRTQLECVDAAREAARAAARGESGEAAGMRVAPAGSSVSVTVEGEQVRATVRVRTHSLGGRLPGFDIAATAVAAAEPVATDPELGTADLGTTDLGTTDPGGP
jgi:Flp pilus assembly protein TadG